MRNALLVAATLAMVGAYVTGQVIDEAVSDSSVQDAGYQETMRRIQASTDRDSEMVLASLNAGDAASVRAAMGVAASAREAR